MPTRCLKESKSGSTASDCARLVRPRSVHVRTALAVLRGSSTDARTLLPLPNLILRCLQSTLISPIPTTKGERTRPKPRSKTARASSSAKAASWSKTQEQDRHRHQGGPHQEVDRLGRLLGRRLQLREPQRDRESPRRLRPRTVRRGARTGRRARH